MKKDNGRFTLRFDPTDPQQQAVIDILNAAGRRKAVLISQALYNYIALYREKTNDSVTHTNKTINDMELSQAGQCVVQEMPNSSNISASAEPSITPYELESTPDAVVQEQDDDILCSAVLGAMNMFNG